MLCQLEEKFQFFVTCFVARGSKGLKKITRKNRKKFLYHFTSISTFFCKKRIVLRQRTQFADIGNLCAKKGECQAI